MEHYSAIKRNETGSFVELWMVPDSVIQRKLRKTKTNMIYYHKYMQSRKMVQMKRFARQDRHGSREWTYGHKGREEGDALGEELCHVYTAVCEAFTDSWWDAAVYPGSSAGCSVMTTVGWHGLGAGRLQKGIYTLGPNNPILRKESRENLKIKGHG